MAHNQRWTRRPPGSTWGDWGPDDERGRLNLLTPEKVLQGVAEVKIGKTFCLSLPLDYPGGAILFLERLLRQRSGRPLEFGFVYLRGDRIQFVSLVTRPTPGEQS